MDVNLIAAELLCSTSNKLPQNPVVAKDGRIYERSELESLNDAHKAVGNARMEFHPSIQLKKVVELLISSGNVEEEYLGGWAKDIDQGGDKDDASDFSLIKTKAEAGDADSMVQLGEIYLKGIGTKKDVRKGYYWFDMASEKENELGKARKADCMLTGLGCTKNIDEGLQILIQGGYEDDSVCCLFRLGYYFSEGGSERIDGLEPDSSKAEKWLNRLKVISPQLSESDTHRMKQELVDTFSPPPSDKENDSHKQVASPINNSHGKVEDEQDASCAKPKESTNAKDQQSNVSSEPTAPEESVGKVPSTEPVKQCFSCGASKLKKDFTPAQYKLPQRTGSCIDCCNKEEASASNAVPTVEQQPNKKPKLNDIACKSFKEASEAGDVNAKRQSNGQSIPVPGGSSIEKEASTPKTVLAVEQPSDKHEQHNSACSLNEASEVGEANPEKSQSMPVPGGSSNKEEASAPSAVPTVEQLSGQSKPHDDCSSNKASEAGDVNAERNHSAPATGGSSSNVKPCVECGQSKSQPDFTASQWRKKVGTGRCFTCVSKSIQWQTGGVSTTLQVKICSECKVKKPHAEFSPNQWRRFVGTGRCKECVKKSLLFG